MHCIMMTLKNKVSALLLIALFSLIIVFSGCTFTSAHITAHGIIRTQSGALAKGFKGRICYKFYFERGNFGNCIPVIADEKGQFEASVSENGGQDTSKGGFVGIILTLDRGLWSIGKVTGGVEITSQRLYRDFFVGTANVKFVIPDEWMK